MPALTPTVHERLARCNTRVRVSGLVSGATVVLSIDGADEPPHVATDGVHHFTVPSLTATVEIRARQDDGSGFTPSSPPVIVEDAQVPPTASPLLPGQVGNCSQCVKVDGLVPGCDVELFQAGAIVGNGKANRHGNACVGVKLRAHDEVGTLSARMIVCGADGPLGLTQIVPDTSLPKPVVGSPLYGCQRIVPLSGLHRGARVRLETNTGTNLGSLCSCWQAVNVRVIHDLVTGEKVRSQSYWSEEPCKDEGDWSDWQDVIAPDEGIKPTVLQTLVEGDQIIRVDNQILGGELRILIQDDESSPIQSFGPRPAGEDLEIALNAPLVAGNQVAVEQTLCGHIEQSDWVTVLPLPEEILAPIVLPPLYECAGSVQVSGLHPGALVRIYQDGIPSGIGWAGMESSISIAARPALVAGAKVTAIQWVGGNTSPESDPVEVLPLKELHRPRILQPVALGDTTVWVSGVTPGARLTIRSNGSVLGEKDAAESISRVTVSPVPGPIQATTRLCSVISSSATVTPIVSPCATGSAAGVGEDDRDYGSFTVPTHSVPGQSDADGGFEHDIKGRLYFPTDASGNMDHEAQDRPLVIIAHGYWFWDEEDLSNLGYGYLACHLARWGMFVFSLNLSQVNRKTTLSVFQQSSRGEIILRAIEELLADSDLGGRFDSSRIGLVGHSMGGEGVVAAQVLNLARPTPFGIKGVVSLAPTQYRPDLQCTDAKYLQLFGSLDLLLKDLSEVTGEGTGANPIFGGFRIYDRAWRDKSHFWIYLARHNGFNHNWWNSSHSAETAFDDLSLTLAQHKQIARCIINAFFQDALVNQSVYMGYLQGLIFPQGLYQYDIFVQHHKSGPEVLDDFGDADNQLGFLEETPTDKTVNRKGQIVDANGTGLDQWEDIEHITLPHSVHDTSSTDLAWSAADVVFSSDTGSLAASDTDVLSLRIAQHYEEATNGEPVEDFNPVNQDIDLFVEIRSGGQTATLRLGSVGNAPYPAADAVNTLSVLRSVRIPIDAFHAVNPSLNLGSITRVSLHLTGRPKGRVLADDLEFTS